LLVVLEQPSRTTCPRGWPRGRRHGSARRSALGVGGHPDWTGPDDLVIKIKELREITKALAEPAKDGVFSLRNT